MGLFLYSFLIIFSERVLYRLVIFLIPKPHRIHFPLHQRIRPKYKALRNISQHANFLLTVGGF
jgi:hypothetical protein